MTRAWWIAFASVAWPAAAWANPPRAFGSRASNGDLALVLEPSHDWVAAEVQVTGGDAIDLGPARRGDAVEVDAWTDRTGPLVVVLRVVQPDGHGVTYRFDMDVQSLPDIRPRFERGAPRIWMKKKPPKPNTP